MKTVTGKVINTAPISLSKAAKVISNFASFDNGASDAVLVYLRRASEAFNGLVQFHKDLKAPNSHSTRKPRNHRLIGDNFQSSSIKVEPEIEEVKPKKEIIEDSGRIIDDGVEEKKRKKTNRKEKFDEKEAKIERDNGGGVVKIENPVKIEKESEEEEGVMKSRDKKKRKRKSEGEERLELEDGSNNENKKRKTGEEGVDSAEKSRKKKSKRIKIES